MDVSRYAGIWEVLSESEVLPGLEFIEVDAGYMTSGGAADALAWRTTRADVGLRVWAKSYESAHLGKAAAKRADPECDVSCVVVPDCS